MSDRSDRTENGNTKAFFQVSQFCDGIDRRGMDLQKQIDYWRDGSEEDLDFAETALQWGKLRHGMFFAHLAVEKMLKAHVARHTKSVPPRIHVLERLAQLGGLKINATRLKFLREFDVYQLEGRYPGSTQRPLEVKAARRDFLAAKEMITWLKNQLEKQ